MKWRLWIEDETPKPNIVFVQRVTAIWTTDEAFYAVCLSNRVCYPTNQMHYDPVDLCFSNGSSTGFKAQVQLSKINKNRKLWHFPCVVLI